MDGESNNMSNDIWDISQAIEDEETAQLNEAMRTDVLREEEPYLKAEQFLHAGIREPLPPEALALDVQRESYETEAADRIALPKEAQTEFMPIFAAEEEQPQEESVFELTVIKEGQESKTQEEFMSDKTNEPVREAANDEFATDTAQFDPLANAENLPDLFPNAPDYTEPKPQRTEPAQEATVVPRPKRKNRAWRIVSRILISILKWTFALVLAVAILAAGLIGYLSVTEYSPAEREKAQNGNKYLTNTVESNCVLRLVTFNIGYGGLGADADFFMDGGKGVTPESEEVVLNNMSGIKRILSDIDADVMFLQEVDTESKRSYEKNQWRQYEFEFPDYETAFATNYACDYVPYPISWDFDFIGKVNSGIATFSRYDIASSTRIALPTSFSWPTRVANLKRCLLVSRLNLAGRTEQLVLVNCHLEAYDDGEAKQAQTELLLNFIEEEYAKGNYVIVGGDFNQTFPDSDAYRIRDTENWAPGKLSELSRGWRYAYDDSAPTCRLLDRPYNAKDSQLYVIDGFILSPNVQMRRVETVDADFEYSDHNPVVLEISLKQ